MLFLRQSTGITATVGPFVASADGNTESNILSAYLLPSLIALSKNGGALAAASDGTSAQTAGISGIYLVPLSASDTNTLGRLTLYCHPATVLPVWHNFEVIPAGVYDSLIASSTPLTANVIQWLGTAVSTPAVAGIPSVDAITVAANAISGTSFNALALTGLAVSAVINSVASVTGVVTAGQVTVVSNLDKSGYALTSTEMCAAMVRANAISASSFNTSALSSLTISAVANTISTTAIADALLGRNIAGGSDGGRTVKDALRILRNKRSIVGGGLTVYTEDDTATAWTATVSPTATQEIDPT